MKRARSQWTGAVLVCGKCSKKVGGGFGAKGRERLAKALRREAGFGKGRKAVIGVVEVKCLGLCPKNAVTVVDTRRPGEWLVIPAGGDLAEVATRFVDE
ncbi:(2Fe-2S) ferredoxin domain-containing protein [Sphingomonas radiodurans]|uniref:(2Fe-2S) ferredoxin domain-containing protein n=1 Tax=Sphingomonas radiodurans TaxID=2890321 RepID=UPI001E425DBD|nr:(2Fe-2S) ferredoxin domain-containing protein [Sphingomonas radiodurans]WBH16086.1 (2Fe-2S) ferredoxin domain-containing protein [Sphingomonas radiodurans]